MPSVNDVVSGLRITAITVGLYDYILTLPDEYALYARQEGVFKVSRACLLFFLVRYTSVLAVIFAAVGYFKTGFSPADCRKFYLAAPLAKVAATFCSQLIVGVRTWAIARRRPWVFYTLVILYVLTLAPEIVSNVFKRYPQQSAQHNCTSYNPPSLHIAWIYYVASLTFDTVSTGIALYYLLSLSIGISMMPRLARVLLRDGLLYFIVLTLSNVTNMVLYRLNNTSLQSSASSLGVTLTMIMSERIILSLHESTSRSENSYNISDGRPQGGVLSARRDKKLSGAGISSLVSKTMGLGAGHGRRSDSAIEMGGIHVEVHKESTAEYPFPPGGKADHGIHWVSASTASIKDGESELEVREVASERWDGQ